ncbi:zinc finger imprinted 2 [Pipistrellus kuhlii]|uniref:zinc finger imprinted 2 n=1 Tax=Pipistrellus kuhlii TaxID=59472 RepID=UPI00174F39C5|nr:zinc finger imprinted 2 [Pipistrellus kuhlii]
MGTQQTLSQIRELCGQRLQTHTKEQMMELLVLERFLGTLPEEVRKWVRSRRPKNSREAGILVANLIQACREEDFPAQSPGLAEERNAEDEDHQKREPTTPDASPPAGREELVTFQDVFVHFSPEELSSLSAAQRRLHQEVMRENYQSLVSLGYHFPRPDIDIIAQLEEEFWAMEEGSEAETGSDEETGPEAQEPPPEQRQPMEEPHPPVEEPHPPVEEPHPPVEEPHPPVEELHPPVEEPHPPVEEPHPAGAGAEGAEDPEAGNPRPGGPPGEAVHPHDPLDLYQARERTPPRQVLARERTPVRDDSERHSEGPREGPPSPDSQPSLQHDAAIHTCEVCLSSFSTRDALQRHFRMNHVRRLYWESFVLVPCLSRPAPGDLPSAPGNPPPVFPNVLRLRPAPAAPAGGHHECAHCGRVFVQDAQLHQHLDTHRVVMALPPPPAPPRRRGSHLIRYQQAAHSHAGALAHQCSDCSRAFNQSSHLVSHYRTHAQEQPFQCRLCGRCFSRPSQLTRHYQLHPPPPPPPPPPQEDPGGCSCS